MGQDPIAGCWVEAVKALGLMGAILAVVVVAAWAIHYYG